MLPIGVEPLVLADGTKINPLDGEVIAPQAEPFVEVPNTEQVQREIVAARCRINDLPVPTGQMNSISVILCYTLFGVADSDIAAILSIGADQVARIKETDSYAKIKNTIVETIIKSDMEGVRGLFVQNSRVAASKMFTLMDSENENTQLSAVKDVLDRSGQRPVDVVEHRHRIEGGLTIEYIDKSKDEVPILDITPE